MKRFLMLILMVVVVSAALPANTVTLTNVRFGVEPPPANQKLLRDTVVVIGNPNGSAVQVTMKFYKETSPYVYHAICTNIYLPAFSSTYHSLLESGSFTWGGLHGNTGCPIDSTIPWDTYTDGFKGFRGKIEVIGQNGATIRAYAYTEGTYLYANNIVGDPRISGGEIDMVYGDYYQTLSKYTTPAMEAGVWCLPWLDIWPPNPSISHPGWDFKVTLENYDPYETSTVKIKFTRQYGDVPSITTWQTLTVIPQAFMKPSLWDPDNYTIIPARVTISLRDYLCGDPSDIASGLVFLKPEGGEMYIYRHWAISLD